MSFGKNLKKTRQKMGFSRKDMADALNITVTAYANYENDDREPKLEVLKHICEKLLISSDALLDVTTQENLDKIMHDNAIKYMSEKGYLLLLESPILLMGKDDYSYYFQSKTDEYDYIPFTTRQFTALAKQLYTGITLLEVIDEDDPEARRVPVTFDTYINLHHTYKNSVFSYWLSNAHKHFSENYKIIPAVYDMNYKKACNLIDKTTLDKKFDSDKDFDMDDFLLKQTMLFRIAFDIRWFKELLKEKYGPAQLTTFDTNAWESLSSECGYIVAGYDEDGNIKREPDPYVKYRKKWNSSK